MADPSVAKLLRRLRGDTHGSTAIEYAIVASLIGGFVAATVWSLGTTVRTSLYDKIAGIF